MSLVLPDIESLIVSSFQQRFHQQFGCDLLINQTSDSVQQLMLRKSGKRLQFPYATAVKRSISSPSDSDWYSRYLFRNGIPFHVEDQGNAVHNMRILPAHIEMAITYTTNRFEGDKDSVQYFARRWLFCARNGSLKFSIVVGRYRLMIGCVPELSVSLPERPSPTDEMASYNVEVQCTLRGFTSETQSKVVGVVKEFNIETEYCGNTVSRTEWEFPQSHN